METKASSPNTVTSTDAANLEVTVYHSGGSVFRETRQVELKEGRNQLILSGLPTTVDPLSLTIVNVEGSGKFIKGPLSYRPANLSPLTILLGSVGQRITLTDHSTTGATTRASGKLLQVIGNQLLLDRGDDSFVVSPIPPTFRVEGKVPEGLSSLSSLVMDSTVEADGNFGINFLYEAEGVAWQPRYEVFYDAKAKTLLRFACVVDLTNNSGRKLQNAGIKLIAGHNQSGRPVHRMAARALMAESVSAAAAQADFQAESATSEDVGEQKLYVLPERHTVENGETKQTSLVYAEGVPVTPEYYLVAGYYGEYAVRLEDLPRLPVNIRLCLTNDEASKLGMALPPGDVRVLEPDKSGSLQKTDSCRIGTHVSVGEKFRLDLRTPCKDLKATRRLTSQHTDPEPEQQQQALEPEGPAMGESPSLTAPQGKGKGKKPRKPAPRFHEETRETVLQNFKSDDVEVLVQESFPHNAEVLNRSHDFAEQAKGSALFKVSVPGNGKSTTITYTVKWQIN